MKKILYIKIGYSSTTGGAFFFFGFGSGMSLTSLMRNTADPTERTTHAVISIAVIPLLDGFFGLAG